jgi:hypothetical protein
VSKYGRKIIIIPFSVPVSRNFFCVRAKVFFERLAIGAMAYKLINFVLKWSFIFSYERLTTTGTWCQGGKSFSPSLKALHQPLQKYYSLKNEIGQIDIWKKT